ncbi:hypothetical protein REMIM1_PF00949 (plasmid) [Rhizobium etli bv. mimosae str. Mim1]|nr:hypothetical protein REMIM1_PF00949 [Rhizobium etli bv. mimosae str. Mim1]
MQASNPGKRRIRPQSAVVYPSAKLDLGCKSRLGEDQLLPLSDTASRLVFSEHTWH